MLPLSFSHTFQYIAALSCSTRDGFTYVRKYECILHTVDSTNLSLCVYIYMLFSLFAYLTQAI